MEAPPSIQTILAKLSPVEISTFVNWAQHQPRDRKSTPRSYFSKQEDELLTELVAEYGCRAWKIIASKMPGRSTRQCRERYQQYLSPTVSNRPWTDTEDETLVSLVGKHGPSWSFISSHFEQRTPVSLKNRWISLIRKGHTVMPNIDDEPEMTLDDGQLMLAPIEFDDGTVTANP